MVSTLLKKAVSHALQGNFGVIKRGGAKKIRSQIPTTVEPVIEEDTPSWLDTDGIEQICSFNDGDYYPILKSKNPNISYEVEKDVCGIEIPIASIDESYDVMIKLIDEDSNDIISERFISVEDTYNYPPYLWNNFETNESSGTITVSIEPNAKEASHTLFRSLSKLRDGSETPAKTTAGLPAIIPATEHPPIFLISIDTLKYGYSAEMEELIDELGDDAIIPSEPRTQGYWTAPSHASMFTGAHPGDHGYVGVGMGDGDDRPIDPNYTTISELLINIGYKCSGLVSHGRILPEFGFGGGFHRFQYDGMIAPDWITREHDSKASVSQLINWIDRDVNVRKHSLFYFLHVFDPHNPHIPPSDMLNNATVDFSRTREYNAEFENAQGNGTYFDNYQLKHNIDPELISDVKSWYAKSIQYTSGQIARLLRYLKSINIFDDSMIIITGDHGEEFGERGFFTHTSLYDANIRPFMAIKPPADSGWQKTEEIDTIDFLPTIAQLVGADIPDQCSGTPVQAAGGSTPRITERIAPDWYSVAVEIDGIKGIFTYDANYPDRPTEAMVRCGPELIEYYDLSEIRSMNTSEIDPSSAKKEALKEAAEDFIFDSDGYSYEGTTAKPSEETLEQLEELGYT